MNPIRLLLDVCFLAVLLTVMGVAFLVLVVVEVLEYLYNAIKDTYKQRKTHR